MKYFLNALRAGFLLGGFTFAAVVENGLTTFEVASDTATASFASEYVVAGADFYTASSSWGNLFPRKEAAAKFEKKGTGLLVKLSDKLGNLAEQSYVAGTNGGRMELSTSLIPGDLAKYAVWDVFLSRQLFSGATFRSSGSKDLVLDTNHWETIEVDDFTLITEAGEWRFILGGDAGVKWKLRSVCDRKWGSPEKRTFDLIWLFNNLPSSGTNIHLSIDMVWSPKPGWLDRFQSKNERRVAEYFENLGLRYGGPPNKNKKTDAASLSAETARLSAVLGENRLDPRSLSVLPLPKKMTAGKGAFVFKEGLAASSSIEGAYSLLSEELASRGLRLKRASPGESASVVIGLINEPAVILAAKKMGMNLEALKGKPEAYALLVKEDSILVAGTELRAAVHGVQSLRQLLRLGANGMEVPAVEILDSPDLAFRGFYLEGGGGIMGTDDFRRILRNTYSRFHANAVMPEIRWSQIQWKSHPEIAGPKARSLADLAASAKEAQALGIEFIPAIFSYGKVQELLKTHPEIAEVSNWQKQGDAWCPNKPETYALFFDLMEELIAATGCRRVHIGHDEIQGMRLCEACRAVPADELFAGDINKITAWLAKKNVTPMIWGDFLLENARWVPLGVGAANSGNPQYGNLIVHPAVGKIDKSVVICDWHYAADRNYPTFKFFADAGYPVVGCPWFLPQNNIGIAKSIGAIRQLGVLDTDWGFLGPRAPGAASILGVTHGWNLSQADPENLKWDADAVLAASLLPIDRPSRRVDAKQIPIDLSASANLPLSGDDTAWFGMGSRHDLSWLPTGEQNFFGSHFAIGPKAVVVAHQESARTVSLKRKAKSFIFLHALQAEDLAVGSKNFATYRVTWADGSATNLMVNNRNAAHWLSKAARKNPWMPWNYAYTWEGLLAWEGMTRHGESVNLQAWEWVNPRPDEAITSIDMKINGDAAGIKLGLVALTAVE